MIRVLHTPSSLLDQTTAYTLVPVTINILTTAERLAHSSQSINSTEISVIQNLYMKDMAPAQEYPYD